MRGAASIHSPFEMVILPSKIHIPTSSSQILKRPRLNEAFGQSLFCPLTTVVASAGFGKSTAILSWVESIPTMPVAWFLLDAEDNAFSRFWRYFIAAIRNADERAALDFSEVYMTDSFEEMQAVIDSLIIQLSAYKGEFVCVLEDFHTIHEVQDIKDSLLYFIRHLPANVHVVISSRQPVHFPTQKMRIEGLLVEITEAELRFTRSEIAHFFQMNEIALSGPDLDEVCKATLGWPTGNKLISLSAKEPHSLMKDALRGARSSINNYLLEEVFSHLTETQQEFLLATSVVSSFCPALAERITGFPKARIMEILDYLRSGNLFIECIEGKESDTWFRYHMLFAEILRARLARMDSERMCAIRKAARDWFEENGFLDYVVEISSETRDYDKIRDIILKNWLFHYMNDSHSTLLHWADLIPEDEIRKSPMLCAVLAMPTAVAGNIERGNAFILNAIENLRDDEDFLFALCMAQKAFIYTFQNDQVNARFCSEKALRHFPEKEYYLRGMMLQVLASTYFESDPLSAKAGFSQTLEMRQALGNKNFLCSAYSNLGSICLHLGHLEEAEYYADMAFDLYPEQERSFKPMLSFAYLTLMGCQYYRSDYRSALETHARFELCCTISGLVSAMATAKTVFAKTLYALGDTAAKGEFFRALSLNYEGALRSFPSLPMSRDYSDTFRTKALEHSRQRSFGAFIRIFEYSLGFHLGAYEVSFEVCAFADAVDSEERFTCLYAHILAALYCAKAAQHVTSLLYLAKALAFAREFALSHIILENIVYLRPLMQCLCADEKWSASDESYYARELLNQLEMEPFRLSEREVEVMRHIADGLTIARTSERLYVSRDTVKKHLANIYAKLGVHSKMQAVAILRQKGMV